jgi:hypothetical protein
MFCLLVLAEYVPPLCDDKAVLLGTGRDSSKKKHLMLRLDPQKDGTIWLFNIAMENPL